MQASFHSTPAACVKHGIGPKAQIQITRARLPFAMWVQWLGRVQRRGRVLKTRRGGGVLQECAPGGAWLPDSSAGTGGWVSCAVEGPRASPEETEHKRGRGQEYQGGQQLLECSQGKTQERHSSLQQSSDLSALILNDEHGKGQGPIICQEGTNTAVPGSFWAGTGAGRCCCMVPLPLARAPPAPSSAASAPAEAPLARCGEPPGKQAPSFHWQASHLGGRRPPKSGVPKAYKGLQPSRRRAACNEGCREGWGFRGRGSGGITAGLLGVGRWRVRARRVT